MPERGGARVSTIGVVDNDIETLATALYVKVDDMLRDWPDLAPDRPADGMAPTLSDAELLTMAVMSALLGFTSERRWLRYVAEDLAGMFPRRIGQSGYNKRVRKAFALFIRVIRMLAMDTSLWSDDVWVVDSTPVECGRSRETARRSDAAGWAEYGYCASHSRYFWGLRTPVSSAEVRVPRRELKGELPLVPWADARVRGQSSASRSMGLRRSCRAAVA
jgi:hypothetical protein